MTLKDRIKRILRTERGKVYFSTGMQERAAKDIGYLQEVYEILLDLTDPKTGTVLKSDALNDADQTERNRAAFASGKPHIVKQCPSSQGRIYVRTISDGRKTAMLKRSYLVTDIYLYTAPEYEHQQNDPQFLTLDEILNNLTPQGV